MSDEDALAVEKPISATEEFRRAWRNSLLWSLLAIVVGFGSADSGVAVSMLGTGLAYNQRLVAGGALLIAAFMFLVYLRARANVRHLNAESAVEASSAKLTDIIEVTVHDAEDARGAIAIAKSTAEYIQNQFENEILRYKSELIDPKNMDNSVSELSQIATAYKPPYMGPVIPDANIVKADIFSRINNRISHLNIENQQKIERGLRQSENVLTKLGARKVELIGDINEQIITFDLVDRI